MPRAPSTRRKDTTSYPRHPRPPRRRRQRDSTPMISNAVGSYEYPLLCRFTRRLRSLAHDICLVVQTAEGQAGGDWRAKAPGRAVGAW